jgi:hypothetical protein
MSSALMDFLVVHLEAMNPDRSRSKWHVQFKKHSQKKGA